MAGLLKQVKNLDLTFTGFDRYKHFMMATVGDDMLQISSEIGSPNVTRVQYTERTKAPEGSKYPFEPGKTHDAYIRKNTGFRDFWLETEKRYFDSPESRR